ncbi:MAG: lytic transglycosylase domain-containing protein [Porphyromonadaceae bacterium]|nr:lytic transglycosylase domain-containing protein [Porphyromonadaceae bacterium]
MIYEEYIKNNRFAFLEELKRICALLMMNPEHLMVVMYAESRLNPQAVNPKSNATGLIQFMPKTALSLGTTVAALKLMTNVEQLAWVYKYFLPYKGKMHSVYDVYKAVFFPASLGKPKDWVFQTSTLSAKTIADANKIIDNFPRDGKITVREFETYVDQYLKKKVSTQSKA